MDEANKARSMNIIQQFFTNGSFDKLFAGVYASSNPVTPELFSPIVKKLVQAAMQDSNAKDMVGVFALGYAKSPDNPTNRGYHIFFNDGEVIYNSESEIQNRQQQEKLTKQKSAFTDELKKLIPPDALNKIVIKFQDVKGNGRYTNILNIAKRDTNNFKETNNILNDLTNPNLKNNATEEQINELYRDINTAINQEYPLYRIKENITKEAKAKPELNDVLTALQGYTWEGEDKFINDLFENDKVRKEIIGDESEEEVYFEDEEEPWIREKLLLLKDKGII